MTTQFIRFKVREFRLDLKSDRLVNVAFDRIESD
jgi:hypothetical protein